MVKNIGYSSRGPGFSFQYLHGSSQSVITPVLRDPMLLLGLHGQQAYIKYTNRHTVKHLYT